MWINILLQWGKSGEWEEIIRIIDIRSKQDRCELNRWVFVSTW